MLRSFALGVLCLGLLAPAAARGQSYEELSELERESADAAMHELGLEPEPNPAGKVVGEVHIVTQDVFESGTPIAWANWLHLTTQPEVLRPLVLLEPGEPWNVELAAESVRILRNPFYHSVVVLFPVKAESSDMVDVLIVTRDLWTLRISSTFEIQGGILTLLRLAAAENNLFGLRKRLSVSFLLQQGTYEMGPTYVDEAVLGTHWRFAADMRLIFSRDTNDIEGSSSTVLLGYPLWNLSRKWGVVTSFQHFDGFVRSFEGAELRTYDNPDTLDVEEIPFRYGYRTVDTSLGVLRSFGTDIKSEVTFGHEVSVQRPEIDGELMLDPATRQAFERDVLPRSELASALFVRYKLFTPVYERYLDLRTYELQEDYRLGPTWEAELAVAANELGGDTDFAFGRSSLSWAFTLLGGDYYRATAKAEARLEESNRLIDQAYGLELYMASPKILRLFRIVAQAKLDWLENETQNRFFTAGGDEGLRGYEIGQFTGESRFLGHLELRTRPTRISFVRFGGVAFWDLGHAADDVSDLSPRHDVGVGVRILIPQIEGEVARIDWAWPLNEPNRSAFGRFTLGFFQVF